ncbi:biotin--[acetyl-CoA-carboxylase] ligase [Flavobacterium sp. GT3R68]|uniref:biotin--[acetyl-CoA-carboxylase] ligase n=1 Tax=Flavobacterium sp. GT3R68 TaxID=2594437 RepID=UPI000F87F726|nr:biotin--[acetyl-CoA-carboxylase] ligase [Flavobacterium sp. GT3R68]RTY91841.1 biotin--[acetyl-CoA-carboxylase] ligase [Flavobacterium sp. GSN2]TRW90181.1 biotin--[acetyl-CoA-carboxylase] ligase [Flavobacterium sp. GT3R68]
MKLIKLDAIDSTNDFLKALANDSTVENYTVVTAENQSKGKGQMGSTWDSEIGKNLIMSILIKNILLDISQIYNLNIAISLSVITALENIGVPALTIKWPNDIMSDNKKIGGILIENSIKTNGEIISVVGLGLNVNQINFENLPKASSLAVIMHMDLDKEQLLFKIVEEMKLQIFKLQNHQSQDLWQQYNNSLFKKGIPMPFENPKGEKFMGIIQHVNDFGRLQILLEDDSIASFDIKEIQMLY